MSTNTIQQSSNYKRLAKNTILLYLRTFLVMFITLYTSRVVLDKLGVDDYGIYNVVGGFVAMFAVISASLSNSISRYITFELGHGDKKRLNEVFSTSINIQLILSAIILVLVESVGTWFLFTYMNLPESRLTAAFWVLQCSLITFIINLISLPYNAAIIAHEQMDVFAYISLLEVTLKLLAVYAIIVSPIDKLVTYAIAIAIAAFIIRIIYGVYCKRKFDECHYHLILNRSLIKEMFGFAGWNFLGTGAYLFNTNGVNIISNIYFGVAVNAARGIAGQAEGGVRQFVNNFTTALTPQIIKTYAEKDYDACYAIVRKGCKFSYFLMLFFFVPLVLEADFVLGIWLKEVPAYSVIFFQLALLGTLVDLPGAPLGTLALATGDIKRFYMYMGSLGCLVFPISFLLFELGFSPAISYWTYVVVYTYLVYVRLALLSRQINFPTKPYFTEVVLPIVTTTFVSFLLPLAVRLTMTEGWTRFIVTGAVSIVSVAIAVYFLGMKRSEREKTLGFIKNKIKR